MFPERAQSDIVRTKELEAAAANETSTNLRFMVKVKTPLFMDNAARDLC